MGFDKKKYFIESRERLKERGFFIKLFSIVTNIEVIEITPDILIKDSFFVEYDKKEFLKEKENKTVEKNDLVLVNTGRNKFYGFVSTLTVTEDNIIGLTINIIEEFKDKPLLSFSESFTLSPNEIENYKGPGNIKTSYGRYFLNYVLFVYPFKDKIEYLNGIFSSSVVDKIVAKKLIDKEVSIKEHEDFEDALFAYGHFGEICVPTVTVKSLSTSEEIIKEREKLIKENKDKLNDPIIAKKINDRLIAMERERLKGDPSERFYNSRGSSAWNIQRSKMNLNIGGIPDFSDEVGKISFIPKSLMDGWDKNHFDTLVNEIFKGSYTRGVQTQLGGTQTKIIIRMFQGSKIKEEDCGTKHGVYFDITDKNVSSFDGMYEAVTNKNINKNTYKDFINKRVFVRSPMTCETKGNGYCYKCWGNLYKTRGAKSVELDGVYVSSKFMLLSMKNMHGTEIQTHTINLEDFLISSL